MSADIYYALSSQNELGQIEKTWQYDRTINCSAIKERAEYNAKNSVDTEKFLSFNVKINFRTPENLYRQYNGTIRRPTDILIAHIKDPAGNFVWLEDSDEDTTFEIESMEPLFDETHTLAGYRALLARSGNQVDNDV
jgi:hypothetical protein